VPINPTNPASWLPYPFNNSYAEFDFGYLIAGTSLYSSFKVSGYDPATKTSLTVSYIMTNPYGTPVYHWYVEMSGPLYTWGNPGYEDVVYSPYNETGLPGDVAYFIQHPYHQIIGP
jgi:hypothetical protein